MARDDKITMRDTLVIAGGLIAVYSALAMLYAETLRSRSDYCADASFILINGLCYTVWKILLPIFLLGIILLVVGIVAFRAKPSELEGRLHHGSGAHFTLALLISLVAIPALLWIIQTVRQGAGDAYVVEFGGTQYEHTFLLELAILVGLVALVPFVGLYSSYHVRRRRFLEAVEEATDEDEEPALPHEKGYTFSDAKPAPGEDMSDDDWPEDRDDGGWEVEETPAASAPGAPGPAAQPHRAPLETPATQGWTAEEVEPAEPEETARGPDAPAAPGDEPESMQESAAPSGESPESEQGGEGQPPWMAAGTAGQSGVVGCLHKDEDGTSCANPVRQGSRYCAQHACNAQTQSGKLCSNPCVEGTDYCHIHAG